MMYCAGKLSCLEVLLQEIIEKENEHVVVASQSTAALDIISSMCSAKQYTAIRIDGSTPTAKRAEIVSSFNMGVAQVGKRLPALRALSKSCVYPAAVSFDGERLRKIVRAQFSIGDCGC